MVRRCLVVCSAFLLLVLAIPSLSTADLITVTFTVFPAPGDPVNTGPSTGYFSFDSSLVPEGGGVVFDNFGLGATEINFAWGHTIWTTANADVGSLIFSPSGQLHSWFVGGRPLGLSAFIGGPAGDVVDDIYVSFSIPFGNRVAYTNAGIAGFLTGSVVTDSVLNPIPEPSSLLLMATGVGLFVRRRRRRPEQRTVGL